MIFRVTKAKDYCTLFFDKIKDYDISGCCLIHDEDYEDVDVTRKESDDHLRQCVNNTTGTKLGTLMFLGVRLFGWIFWYWHRLKSRKHKY